MKKFNFNALLLLFALSFCTLFGCSSRNMKEELPGEWFIWHWYYNVKDGENGFFDEAQFYTFNSDGTLTMEVEGKKSTATYTFNGNDKVDVVYEDGTTDTFQLIAAEHDGVDQIQFMNVNNNYTLTLEPMSSWKD